MRFIFTFLIIAIAAALVSKADAQRLEDVLATSKNTNFAVSTLTENGQRYYLQSRKILADTRVQLLSEMIEDAVLELESKSLNTTSEKLLAERRAKVPAPTVAEIQKIYNANTSALGGRPLEEVRDEIVAYLKHDAENKVITDYIQALRTKYKATLGKDINMVGLTGADVLATVGTRSITVAEYDKANRVRLNDTQIVIDDVVRGDLEAQILSTLANAEAKERNLDAGSYIAAEITDKLRLYTDEERESLETALKRRLFTKYDVKIMLPEPTPIVQNIAVEADDPQTGRATAPVTVVMFTDLQCPACSGTHPILKRVLTEYGDKIHFVVRDFPLESIHKNAFNAALAANAARLQGKFFEYAEVLYRNQDALDKTSLVRYAAELGLNVKQFELDFSDAKTAAEVRKDQADGRSYGVGGTPTIFVNGVKVYRLSADAFRRAIDRALSK